MPATPPQPEVGVTVTTGNGFTLNTAGADTLRAGMPGAQVPLSTQR